MITDVLFLSLLVFILLLLFFAGSEIIHLFFSFPVKEGDQLFDRFLKGLVFLVPFSSIIALWETGLKSIQLLSLIVMLIFLIPLYRQSSSKQLFKKERFSFIPALLPLLVLSGLTCFLSFIFPLRGLLDSDVSFYTRVAESLFVDHRENYFQFFNERSTLFGGTSPYHYIELWFAGFIFKLFSFTGFSDFILVKFVMYNFFRCLAAIGILSLLKSKLYWGVILICILLIPDYNQLVDFNQKENFFVAPGLFHRPNFIINLTFLIPVFYFLLNFNGWYLAIFSSLLMLISSVNVPAVGGAMFLFYSFLVITKKLSFKKAIQCFSFIAAVAISISIFYKLSGLPSNVVFFEPLTLDHLISQFKGIWKASVFYIAIISFKTGILLLLSYFFFKEVGWAAILFCFLLTFVGLCLFQLVPTLDNMYQLAYVGYAAISLLIVYCLFSALQEKAALKYLPILGVLVFLIYKKYEFSFTNFSQESVVAHELVRQGYSNDFAINLEKKQGTNPARFGVLLSRADIQRAYSELRHANTYQVGYPLMNVFNNCNLLPLTDSTILFPDEERSQPSKDLRKSLHFFRQLDYTRLPLIEKINKLKPEVLVCSLDQSLPSELPATVADSLTDKDHFQKIYFINYDKK